MSNEKWSEWIDWSGGECPLVDGIEHEIRFRNGDSSDDDSPETWRWTHIGEDKDIIAYRYRIEEPTEAAEGMHPDLEWLAKTVHEWQGTKYVSLVDGAVIWTAKPFPKVHSFMHEQWLQARKDLGLDYATPKQEADWHKEEPWSESVPEGVITDKQLRYLDAKGEDWIDEFSRTATVDEFRGAMRFTIGKYNRRAGKKDELIREIEKMEDYCRRWKQYELSR